MNAGEPEPNPIKPTTFGCRSRFQITPLVYNFCKGPFGKQRRQGIFRRGGETYTSDSVRILRAGRTDRLYRHQPSINQPLGYAGYPPSGGGSTVWFNKSAVGDPVALRQEPTPGRDLLKSTEAPVAECEVAQRGVEELLPNEVRNVQVVKRC